MASRDVLAQFPQSKSWGQSTVLGPMERLQQRQDQRVDLELLAYSHNNNIRDEGNKAV